MSRPDVIVVGAGPVGLLLAAELRLGGASVAVLESLSEPSTASRASTLHARTMELFDQRGLLAHFRDAPVEPRGHFAGLSLDLGAVDSRYAGQWKVLQQRTEQVLAEWARRLGATIRRGVRVVGLKVTDAGTPDEQVTLQATGTGGPELLSARYVVGCDGETSTVRTAAGFPVVRIPPSRRLLRADVEDIDVPARRFERLPGGVAISARRPDGATRIMMCDFNSDPSGAGAEVSFDEVCNSWKRITGEDITGGRPTWLNAFDNAALQATTYRKGPVLLAGDAAHVQLPVGGQALNLGLQDAANLGWKLAAEVTGRAPDGLLDSYSSERQAAGARTLNNIRAQAALLFGGDEVDGMRDVLTELLQLPDVRTSVAGAISGVQVRYPAGADDHPAVGSRLPILDLTTIAGPVSSAELLRSGRGLLLVLRNIPHLIAEAAAADSVMVVAATLNAAQLHTDCGDLDAILVRPDGHLAWAQEQSGPDRTPHLRAALARWFTRQRRSES
jgi:oxygenase